MGRPRSTPDEQKKLSWVTHRRDKPLRNLDFFARSDMFGSHVRGLWPFCSPIAERWNPAIALLSLRKSAFCFPEDPARWPGSSGEAAEGVSRGMKRILRAWRAARKTSLFEGLRGLWDRIRCGRKSGLVRLPRLGSRVRIPSPAPGVRCLERNTHRGDKLGFSGPVSNLLVWDAAGALPSHSTSSSHHRRPSEPGQTGRGCARPTSRAGPHGGSARCRARSPHNPRVWASEQLRFA